MIMQCFVKILVTPGHLGNVHTFIQLGQLRLHLLMGSRPWGELASCTAVGVEAVRVQVQKFYCNIQDSA